MIFDFFLIYNSITNIKKPLKENASFGEVILSVSKER